MKISFEFEPHERVEIEEFVRGPDYKNALRELDGYLRAKLKHADLSEPEYDAYCDIRTKLNELTEGLDVYT